MTDKRLYEVINPSDKITFRATVVEAACIADRLREGLFFVKDIETGEEPAVENLEEEYDAIWRSAQKLASYAEAYRSFLVGTVLERELLEEAVSRMSEDEAKAYRMQWHDKRCTSYNDICKQVWDNAERIATYVPENSP
ncbi:hypothetical protein GOZ83_19555 [Agrobacterium vitis]|uniref:hypothetical protein n=1 Tax=Agrobacterium vitis TaxID=373 RepID=UPI0012E77185|nr:hypothetical protein [Agrobacterium vitis]MVA47254.1 hypothetical protein [Agrobacterium vitis]